MIQKYLRLFVAAIFSFALFGGLFACDLYSVMDFTCFNTDVYIAVKGNLNSETDNNIRSVFSDLENLLSLNKNGDVQSFNSSNANETTVFNNDAYNVAVKAKELYSFTDGLFNPAVLPLLRLWKLSSDTFDANLITINPPSAEEIAAILPLCDFSKITFLNGALKKTESGICLDFGGIAKGYAVDMAKDILSEAGLKDGYISVGGSSLYAFSTEEDLSVKHPRKTGEYIFTVDKNLIKNSPLSTSGDYMRYYTDISGKRYPHIINGFTGYPADTGIISATVIAGENAESSLRSACATDAISTALMLMEKEKAESFIKEKLNGFYVFLVYEQGGEKGIISNTDKINITDAEYGLTLI